VGPRVPGEKSPQGSHAGVAQAAARLRLTLLAAGAGGLALCATSVAVTLSGPTAANPGFAAAGRALMVGVPIAVGLYAWHRRPEERFGPLLVAVGFGWFVTTLAESGNGVLYSVGRVAGWAVEVGLVYLILSFPSGRLTQRVDRALVWAAALLVAAFYLPTALIADSYPVPSQYASCEAGCPSNAFFVLGSEPSFVYSLLIPLREGLTALLFLAVTARLVGRFRGSTRLMQHTLEPVLTVAVARCGILVVGILVRWASPESAVLEGLAWTIAFALPVLAAAFLLGLVSQRLYAANVLQDLGKRVRGDLPPNELRAALAEAVGDPSLEVAYWTGDVPGHWVDHRGRRVAPPRPESGHHLTEVRDGERRVAAILHDAALSEERKFLDAVASYALIALRNRRLTASVESALSEIRESRARILASADRERRRIERDLHDGAQQRLVALRIQLELLEELMERDPEGGLKRLRTLGDEVDETIDEIRALARGVYPSLLEDRGLAEALRSAALRVPVSASVKPGGIGRYPHDVESAVYFCCLEAMQNASKHARDARAITISLTQDDALSFEVRDDGAGFYNGASPGMGLTNMRDRLTAVGGRLTVRSSERGAVVAGSVPLAGAGDNGGTPRLEPGSRRAGGLQARWTQT
jgi:signal transduction histidine kinase